MFTFARDTNPGENAKIPSETSTQPPPATNALPKLSNKFKNAIQTTPFDGGETNLSALEDLL